MTRSGIALAALALTPAAAPALAAEADPKAPTTSELVPAPAPVAAPRAAQAPAGSAAAQPFAPNSASAPYDGPALLLGSGKPKLGAYASLGFAYSHMLHRDGVVTDFEAAILADHRLSLGLAGYFFSRTPYGPAAADGTLREFATGYGGLRVRYAAFAQGFPLYVSVGVLVGGGVLTLLERRGSDSGCHQGSWNENCAYGQSDRYAGYFVVQPDISIHANATRWLRFSLTGGYRAASGAGELGFGAPALSGLLAGGSIDMGWF